MRKKIGLKKLNLKSLGFDNFDEELMNKLLKSTHGIILVTGPTGSGKTTTLYSMLNHVNRNNNNIVTIEEPVEMALKGINQVNVNNKAGANGLRCILRQDPDIVMVGEIRDEVTAEIVVRTATIIMEILNPDVLMTIYVIAGRTAMMIMDIVTNIRKARYFSELRRILCS